MSGNQKLALSWFELLLVVAMIAIGVGVWATIERKVTRDQEKLKPREAAYLMQENVPLLEATLTITSQILSSQHTEIATQQLEVAQQEAKLALFDQEYTQLKASQFLTNTLHIPQEVLRAGITNQSEMVSKKALADAIELQTLNVLTETAKLSETLGSMQPTSPNYQAMSMHLSVQQEIAAGMQEKVVQMRLEQADHTASRGSMIANYPALEPLLQIQDVPMPVLQAYLEASRTYYEAKQRLTQLDARAKSQEQQLMAARKSLEEAKRKADEQFRQVVKDFETSQRQDILIYTGGVFLVLWILMLAMMYPFRYKLVIKLGWPFGMSLAATALVLVYQVWPQFGLMILGLGLLIGMIALLALNPTTSN